MKTQSLFALGVLVFHSASCLPAFAQGTAFTYQGSLSQSNAPVTGPQDFEFRLFNTASGGAQQGSTIPVNDLAVSNGLFTATLDFGPAAFPGADRWLEIAVRPGASSGGYTTLSPRQPVTATPYAIAAGRVTGPIHGSAIINGSIGGAQIAAGTVTAVNLGSNSVTASHLAAGSVTTSSLAGGAVSLDKLATTVAAAHTRTIPNPSSHFFANFGSSLAPLGPDRLVVGSFGDDGPAGDAGAAYLVHTNGTLLTTLTNPTPANFDRFGTAVAMVGMNRILIGAPGDGAGAANSGVAYLFSTNGTRLLTITNPTPASLDGFGFSVAAVGADRFLVGASGDGTVASGAGAAYLFSTNGALLATFAKPGAAEFDQFGISVAAVGTDKVVVGAFYDDTGTADAGAAYLFRTNGTFLMAFPNPTPAAFDQFGQYVAAVGADKVLIGAPLDDAGAPDAGAAYLFSTTGTLLVTFLNPTPGTNDYFGTSVAAVGTDKVLIGAYGKDSGGMQTGAAYLFSLSGALLATIPNPAPTDGDAFGVAVAALSSDRLVLGDYADEASGTDSGSVFLFALDSAYMPGLISAGVVDHSITSSSLVDGAVGSVQIADGSVSAADLAPSAGLWSKSGNQLFHNDGNVGIGTSNPQTLLHLYSPLPVTTLRLQSSGGFGAARLEFFSDPQGSGAEWRPGYIQSTDNGGFTGGLSFHVNGTGFDNRLGDLEVMRIVDGRVGINTPNPLAALEVSGGAYADFLSAGGMNTVDLTSTGELQIHNSSQDGDHTFTGNLRQMITLGYSGFLTAGYGLGLQTNNFYFRSEADFSWFRGGSHRDTPYDPGSVFFFPGTELMRLSGGYLSVRGGGDEQAYLGGDGAGGDIEIGSRNPAIGAVALWNAGSGQQMDLFGRSANLSGTLSFGSQTRQMLNLWGTGYGIGVQASTLYFRCNAGGPNEGFSWYKGGTHDDNYANPGGGLELMHLVQGGLYVNGTFVSSSDRNAKENFIPVDPQSVLEKVAALPLSEWNYKTDGATRHIGPMAQDFHAAFGVGPDDKHIATVDADGVALAAIQGLNQRLTEELKHRDAENAVLKQRLEKLEEIILRSGKE